MSNTDSQRLDAMRRQRDGYRNQLRKTEQQVARVRELHDDWQGYCTECDAKLPCPTIRALDGEQNE